VKLPLLSLPLIALSGCVPVLSYDYDVKGQGEKSESGGCSPTTEVRLTTQLTQGTAVVFWGSVERLHHSHRIVSISFTLADDETLSLTKPDVLVSSQDHSIPRAIPISTVRRSSVLVSPSCDPPTDSAYQQFNEPMHRVPGTYYGAPVIDSIFAIDIAVSGNPAQFTVQLPPVLINGNVVSVPAVTFLRKSSLSFPAIM
jgi:hypothetical protein